MLFFIAAPFNSSFDSVVRGLDVVQARRNIRDDFGNAFQPLDGAHQCYKVVNSDGAAISIFKTDNGHH